MTSFPTIRGQQATADFNEWFNPYQTIKINEELIVNPSDPKKLTKCPNFYTPLYIITNIETKGFIKKKKYVTIEKV